MTEKESIKEVIKERYGSHALKAQQTAQSCCGPTTITDCGCGCGATPDQYAKGIGYTQEELTNLPDTAITAAAGCGNPTAIAGLKEGEVVLDLGSGGGIDVFLSAQKVGPNGKAIGVDMTDEMLDLARKNAKELGIENVEFRKGDIEELPVEDESVDVIISNCVINLAPDKDKVFREAYRVLKPGGRLTVSDIVTKNELPQHIKDNLDLWAGCVSGAIPAEQYMGKLRDAGFKEVKEIASRGFGAVYSAEIEAHKPL
ncbi:MAG: arsenite methyltransferase [Candidatus Bathyarchaeota archaeon]|nr:arsenite methyltransferase [Candidatus Bathyarchaeota archaeon]